MSIKLTIGSLQERENGLVVFFISRPTFCAYTNYLILNLCDVGKHFLQLLEALITMGGSWWGDSPSLSRFHTDETIIIFHFILCIGVFTINFGAFVRRVFRRINAFIGDGWAGSFSLLLRHSTLFVCFSLDRTIHRTRM